MQLHNVKIALFVADLFEDLEFWYPYYRLKEEGADVTVIGPEKDTYLGKNGLFADSDVSARDANPEDYAALIVPGGYSPDHMRRHPEMVDFVKRMHSDGKIVAAICHGPWMLASADIVRNKRITGFYSIKDDMMNAGGKWEDNEAVFDDNIITSRKVEDLPAFCRTLIESLVRNKQAEREPSEREAWAGKL